MRSLPRRLLRSLTWGMVCLYLAALASPVLAQGAPAAPVAAPGPQVAPLLQAAPASAAAASAVRAPAMVAAEAGVRQAQQVVRQATPVAQSLNPQLGQQLKALDGQVNNLVKNVHTVEQNWNAVSQSANKISDVIDSYPQQLQAYRTRYNVPANASLQQEVEGAGRFMRDKLNISPERTAQLSRSIKATPIYEQLRQPFQPANVMLAVGATAGVNILAQLRSDEGFDLGKALGFVGESSFWGGLVGSGVGYGLMAAVATSLFPGGAGLVGVLTPMFAGMTGSIFGHEIGSGLASGESLSDTLGKLSPANILGQAGGSTVGLLVGSQVGAALGGTLGSIAGPLGAVAGAVLLGQVGAKIGDAVKSLFQGDDQPLKDAVNGAEATLQKLEKTGKTLEKAGDILSQLIPASLPAASLAAEGLPAKLKDEYDSTYEDLRDALEEGDRARAFHRIQYLQKLEARYQEAVGSSLQKLANER